MDVSLLVTDGARGWVKIGGVTHLSAIRYLGPSFSSSAMTQSVIVGMPGAPQLFRSGLNMRKGQMVRSDAHFANRQSIMPWTSSSLFWSEWLMKLVSTRTRYGGPSAGLCERKRPAGAA